MNFKLFIEALFKYVFGLLIIGLLLFLPGTFSYWQGWLFIGVFFKGHLFFLNFVLNVYELFLILWYFVLAYYTVLISFENDKKFMSFYYSHKEIINKIFWITSLLLCSVCFLLTNEIS